jgi:tetratricopeptide (TPR) repeat protein/tRNA A-37 threonylcarbamoyl transferase component Bud32
MGEFAADDTGSLHPAPLPTEPIVPLVARLRANQQWRWAKGDRVRIDAYLRQHPELEANEDALLALVMGEILLRQEAEDKPEPQDYIRRWPHLALQIGELFAQTYSPGSSPLSAMSGNWVLGPLPNTRDGGGVQIPGYEILGELGRGGMGVVYKARQTQLGRLVALKMIRDAAHAGASERARFRTEAEAVARLQHPNIVQIYEVGEHGGCPFFSLEYLEGGSLSRQLARQGPLAARPAAELVERLARALHEAHLRGIIHRDLKPANVLLALDGTPKIADFGLAKKLDDASAQTQTGDVVGTPSYMPPEQAGGRAREVSPLADVYALGAILYEVLTSRPPFRAESGVQTVLQVLHDEPLPPSRLQPTVPRDLETIVLKCLEKDPAKRYPSAAELADDLHRFLANEPIRARPVGTVERLVKWARRRPTLAALVGVSTVALVTLVSLGAWSNVRLRERAEEAQRERERAERTSRLARQAVDDMYVQVAERWLSSEPHQDPLQREFLEKALHVYEELAREDSTDPAVQRQRALAYVRVGQIYAALGRRREAEPAFWQAIRIQEELCHQWPDVPDYRQDLANSWNWLGEFLRTGGEKLQEAGQAYHMASLKQEMLVKEFPANPAYQRDLARTFYNLGIVRMDQGEPEALGFFNLAITRLDDLIARHPDERDHQQDLARSHLNRGILYRNQGRTDDATADYGQAIALFKRLTEEEPRQPAYRYELAVSCNNRGMLFFGTGHLREAEADHRAALPLLGELVRDYTSRPIYVYELANTHNSLGAVLALGTNRAAAEDDWRESRQLFEKLVERDAAVADYQYGLGRALGNLGWLRLRQRNLTAARDHLNQGIQHLHVALKSNPENPNYLVALRNQGRDLAAVLLGLNDHAGAAGAAAEMAKACRGPKESLGAARLLARCVAAAEKDTRLSEADRQRSAQRYTEQALEVLRQAVRQGFHEWDVLDKSPDFERLRARADFDKLRTATHE